MDCDFKPGDEVVCVEPVGFLTKGGVYVIDAVVPAGGRTPIGSITMLPAVSVEGAPSQPVGLWGYHPRRFRKVERRNDSLSIEAFLTIKPGQFEEPRKAPAKKREKA